MKVFWLLKRLYAIALWLIDALDYPLLLFLSSTECGGVESKMEILYKSELITKLNQANEIIIYGAGVMGKALMTCLRDAPYNRSITCFLVESMENNPKEIEGIPVLELEHGGQYKESTVFVALHEKYMAGAMEKLRKEGFLTLIPISFDSDNWSVIRGNWFYTYQHKNNRPYIDFNEALNSKVHVYVAHSISDKKIDRNNEFRNFEIPIQVGAALTNTEMFPTRDSQGDNISEKNLQYCELTALYWIWKHDNAQYAGLSHYRRRFKISEEQAEYLISSDIDVIVTVPVLNFAGVRQQYCNDHDEKDWAVMLEAIKEIHPEYVSTAESVQNGIYYYAYNMFIARKEILNNYCEWLFPILFYCEKKIGMKTDSYQNRYIGFLAERLLTIYFTHNKQYKLVVAQKHFIENV